jgi:SAP domain
MAEELTVAAEPTPDPTPEEAGRLRLQLNRDLAMWEAAGASEQAEAVKARLAELPEEEVVEEEVVEEDFGTGDYEGRTLEQLRALARSKGIASSGTKDEVIERLRA